ncbi:hypothetical protein [Bosea sp. 685]|uniref:hypothetical protein n=1 Tax=Bosea sp. 685 TaxID=3080057 RepID=UPI002892A50E|nr:hypothetical protein [Bosea sp. 685]WNJ89589.1 hypothetical protein RMR04_24780 [Bosea sp. 685]
MIEQSDEALVRELGKQLTMVVAPKEAPHFDEIVDDHLEEADAGDSDHPLGFGSEIMEIVSYALYDVAKKVVAYLLVAAAQTAKDITKDVLKKELKPKLERWIASIITKQPVKIPPPVALSAEQITHLLAEVDRSLTQKRIKAATRLRVKECLMTALQP